MASVKIYNMHGEETGETLSLKKESASSVSAPGYRMPSTGAAMAIIWSVPIIATAALNTAVTIAISS